MSAFVDQAAAIVAELEAVKAENKSLKTSLAMNAGALQESRAENANLHKAISRMQATCNGYEAYFRSLHHGLTDLRAQNSNAGESFPSRAPTGSAGGQQLSRPAPDINSPEVVSLIKARAQAAIRKMGGAA